jgi:hypothetical protein
MDELSQASLQRGGWWYKLRAAALRFQRLFAKFWWILFFSTAAGLAISAWVIFQQKTVFVSTGRMMVSGGIKLQEGAVFNEELANFFGTQVELLTDDTSSLAPKLDAALFVLRFSQSSARLSRKALEQLRDRQTNVIGLVCNGLSRGNQEYYHYKYPEYYSAGKNAA